MNQSTVLIVDDHADIRALVREYLEASDFQVLSAECGRTALEVVGKEKVDLVILDLNIPGPDGFEVCRQLRKVSSVPVIVLSARSEDIDKILAIELGADDYLTKPFNPRELVARVQSIFRRMTWDKGSCEADLGLGPLTLSQEHRQAFLEGVRLPLTPLEFGLLSTLAQNRGFNLSRQDLLDKVWGSDYCGDERTVDAHIRGVRAKLQAQCEHYRPIVSVWGVGYRFEV